jgi:hypothetical protein
MLVKEIQKVFPGNRIAKIPSVPSLHWALKAILMWAAWLIQECRKCHAYCVKSYAFSITCQLRGQLLSMCTLKEYLRYATSRNVEGSIPDEVIGFFNWPNSYSCIMTLGSTQPLTEMSTRNLPRHKERQARMAENLTSVSRLWEPRRLTNLWASTARYRDSFIYFMFLHLSVTQFTIL